MRSMSRGTLMLTSWARGPNTFRTSVAPLPSRPYEMRTGAVIPAMDGPAISVQPVRIREVANPWLAAASCMLSRMRIDTCSNPLLRVLFGKCSFLSDINANFHPPPGGTVSLQNIRRIANVKHSFGPMNNA